MIRLTTCLAIVAVLAAGCGGSDSGLSAPSGVATATIESIDGPFSAFTSGPFVLTGTGFGPVGTTVPVRFTSVIGAVFDGGSSEWATVDGTITSPTTITGMTPTAIPAGEFTTFVGVTLPGGKALLSFVPIARFVALEVAGAGTLSVPSDIPTDIEVEGDAFGTPGDMVTVKFVAATDAFRGGPSGPNATSVITAVGEVIDSTTVRVQTPVAGASLPTPARIGVVRADGFEGLSTTADLVFEPPSVTSATITSAQGSRPILWTLEGAGFVTPVGTATLLTMHYTAPAALPSGSPTATAMGMIIADGTIEAYTPLVAMLPAKVEVSVEIEFASGARVPLQSGGLTLEPTPVVMDDSFDVLTNVGLDVGSSAPSGDGLLANDSDPDPADTLSVVEFDAASTAGGQVVVRADGSFTYNPPPGFAGADAFTYTASDGVATAVGRVDLTVRHDVGTRTWFLHAEAAESSARDGRLLSPFRTVADFEAAKSGGGVGAPAAGDALFIFADTAVGYHAGLVLLDDMTLLGERAGLTLRNPPVSGAEVVIVPAGETTLLGDAQAPPMNVPAITLGANNTIRGLTVRNRRGAGLVGTAVGTLTVRDMSIAALGGSALDIDGGTLDVWLEDCSTDFTLTAAGAPDEYPAHGLRLLDVSGEVRIAPGNTTLPDADMTVVPTGTGQAAFRGTRLEAILVADTSGPLDVTSTGVTIREFASHGLVLDTVQGTFTVEETLQISEPRAPTSPMQSRVLVRITDSSADVLFDSVALTGGKVSAAAVTEVVANGIELIANTGTFQILGGGLGVCGDSAVLARDCTGAITLDGTKDRDDLGDLPDGLNIHSTGQRESAAASPPAHGVWVQNCTGAISIKQCTFNAIGERGDPTTKAASILPADANDAVRVE
ncbi:MAG: Ig-like domain-containing protein, partial [Planctomycetota bacterium]|nr:Ig-like domain-containing protein [Planctomycetota bacterium]